MKLEEILELANPFVRTVVYGSLGNKEKSCQEAIKLFNKIANGETVATDYDPEAEDPLFSYFMNPAAPILYALSCVHVAGVNQETICGLIEKNKRKLDTESIDVISEFMIKKKYAPDLLQRMEVIKTDHEFRETLDCAKNQTTEYTLEELFAERHKKAKEIAKKLPSEIVRTSVMEQLTRYYRFPTYIDFTSAKNLLSAFPMRDKDVKECQQDALLSYLKDGDYVGARHLAKTCMPDDNETNEALSRFQELLSSGSEAYALHSIYINEGRI